MRSKCLHEKGKAPCQACREAGLGATDCVFPVRGQPDADRDYRHPRVRAEKNNKRDPVKVRREILDAPVLSPGPSAGPKPPKGVDEWDQLPPLPEIIEAVNQFTGHYFQLGFIPKQQFPERLQANPRSVSVFFLLGILSVSARLTPCLIQRHGTAVKAAEWYMERATNVALQELYKEPDLEKCQAFYLLSIAQQGSGMKDRSSINMGIAMRMATLMQLHREETYVLVNPTKDLIIRAESARRTLDNLHSGPRSPVSLSASDITTLLPSNEDDFANAREPNSRAALEDTPPALKNPKLVADDGRSLFATLIQAHYYWGAISRRAIKYDRSERPWEPTSEYAKMAKRLADWEGGLKGDHRWSTYLLKGYKQEGQDLAYLGVTMITRLCNIVIRKAYLHEMISLDKSDPKLASFWAQMAVELFSNVKALFEQIDTQYVDKSPEEGMGAQMAAFCVYTCGFLACYLCKYPNICREPSITRDGPNMVQRILNILAECKSVWPLASRWYDHLERFYNDQKGMAVETEGSMADSREPIPHVLHPALNIQPVPIQPRMVPPSPEEKHRMLSQSPSTPVLPVPQQQQNTTPTMYIDPSLRLPVPQQPPPQGGSQTPMVPPGTPQQTAGLGLGMVSPHHAQNQQQQLIGGMRQQSTDGLGLLIEAFDSHTGGGVVSPPTAGAAPGPPPYDPHAAAAAAAAAAVVTEQGYYHPHHQQAAAALGMNDGYENELGYYMSDPGGVSTIQNWAVPGGNMYATY
ncbi:hypothetical protein B0H66DRAFT_466912 [Apodospora peruviana]|uniref:Transcription factor domain-containing protein n=1 Tax=Apodospora peruviana TaxID=516989 RepID=A0AAE0IV02_9PEZI|nr:hypothetical protein B0H66DRAFT_466912 [Apodospora peruviana]